MLFYQQLKCPLIIRIDRMHKYTFQDVYKEDGYRDHQLLLQDVTQCITVHD